MELPTSKSDETLDVRVSVTRIAPSLLGLGHGVPTGVHPNIKEQLSIRLLASDPICWHVKIELVDPTYQVLKLRGRVLKSGMDPRGYSARSRSRSEGAIRATLIRTPSASSLLRARHGTYLKYNYYAQASEGKVPKSQGFGVSCDLKRQFGRLQRSASASASLCAVNSGTDVRDKHPRPQVHTELKRRVRPATGGVTPPPSTQHQPQIGGPQTGQSRRRRQITRVMCYCYSGEACLTLYMTRNDISHSTHTCRADTSKYRLFTIKGATVAEQLGDPGSIPGRVTPNFHFWESYRTILLVGGVYPGSPTSPAPSFHRCSILVSITHIGSEDLDFKSHPNLFTHSITHLKMYLTKFGGKIQPSNISTQ
ncbi:hypothetical protein PR048_008704 [Dryococelus australis]|uniref:Uncharacterized protein n=1 Tax=Dryococelus australis TaxID=614101 RepID=A0ABQ9HYP8_9NEOP|nr:hypothetical protein PR048_008704 [Dryococelus australis]